MTFLKKLGSILNSALQVLAVVFPVIAPLVGSGKAGQVLANVNNDLTSIGTDIVSIETALQGKAGADKLAAAIPLVGAIIKTSELVTGHKIANEALFQKAVQEYAQATVDLLNALSSDGVKTV